MHSTISYSVSHPDDPLRQFDLYVPTDKSAKLPPLLCFIHGGAWRSDDKGQHAALARSLVTATGCSVAVPNYRLTPPGDNHDPLLRHPIHAEDIRDFLLFLRQSSDLHAHFDKDALVLLGHSCSAHMLSCILLDDGHFDIDASVPSQDLLRAVKAVVFSEGIYDLDALITRFPDYRQWFVQAAFGPSESYAQFNVLQFPMRQYSADISWLLLHSKGDTLVNVEQSQEMYTHLRNISQQTVSINTDDLTEEHDNILATNTYTSIVHQFISKFL